MAILAVVTLKERLRPVHWIAIALLLAGQWWLGGGAAFALDSGGLLILIATLLWSAEAVLARWLLASVSSWTLGVVRMGVGSVVLLGWLGVTGRLGMLATLTAAQWGWVLLTGVLLAAYVATWFAALARAQAVDVTAVLVLGAVITALIDAGVRGVLPGPVPALLCVLAGVGVFAAMAWRGAGRLAPE